ncbi:hypothetical protein B0J17DRAFT_293345 [Rhizoctonia solani]|nr:hypothetical protein B0J17DRAFT_293345 [Rhizoctonia solani]
MGDPDSRIAGWNPWYQDSCRTKVNLPHPTISQHSLPLLGSRDLPTLATLRRRKNSSAAGYVPLPAEVSQPTVPVHPEWGRLGQSYRDAVTALEADPRYHDEPPKWWQRALLLIWTAVIFYLSFKMRLASFVSFEVLDT